MSCVDGMPCVGGMLVDGMLVDGMLVDGMLSPVSFIF